MLCCYVYRYSRHEESGKTSTREKDVFSWRRKSHLPSIQFISFHYNRLPATFWIADGYNIPSWRVGRSTSYYRQRSRRSRFVFVALRQVTLLDDDDDDKTTDGTARPTCSFPVAKASRTPVVHVRRTAEAPKTRRTVPYRFVEREQHRSAY